MPEQAQTRCSLCAEVTGPGDRCRACGERLDGAEPLKRDGFGRDSVLVAVICVVVTAGVLIALWLG